MTEREIKIRAQIWGYFTIFNTSENEENPVIDEMICWAMDMLEKNKFHFAKIPVEFDEFMKKPLEDMKI